MASPTESLTEDRPQAVTTPAIALIGAGGGISSALVRRLADRHGGLAHLEAAQ
jgi:hypothetical protein